MKKFGIIGVLILAVVILVGFVVLNGSDKDKAKTESVTIKNAETEECLDDCENCPENMEGECTGTEHSDVYVKDAQPHEKGSKECQETIKAGKCPGKCPHSQETQSTDKEKI